MRRRTEEESELLALRIAYVRELSQSSIRRRWGITDWDVFFPWWRAPAKVRILMYADGGVRFSGGLFGGLQHVQALLESRAYFNVDFEVTTAHREGDKSATIKDAVKLTDPDLDILNNFDEIWFFGIRPAPPLPEDELKLLDKFMTSTESRRVVGGVLATGDHKDLGKALAGEITRVGEMRQYPAPGSGPKESNTTLEEGPDENKRFNDFDQSDDRPQSIRLTPFPAGPSLGSEGGSRPHPVLCGPDGPIDVFPDHRHEGEAVVPEGIEGKPQWPTNVSGHQEQPYVIAKGLIKDPDAIKHGQEIGLVSAYNGHTVDVGRIVADSSWHHWFDINLLGVFKPPSPYAGFDATPAGQAALKKIEAYFLNCGAWLAPPDKQAEMRNAAWWSILWTDQIAELSAEDPIWYLGEQAISALRQRASSCAVTDWVLNSAFNKRVPIPTLEKMFEQAQLTNLAFEQYIAGGILRQLMLQVGPANPKLSFPFEAPPDEELERAIDDGVDEGIKALKSQLKSDAEFVSKLVANDFRLEKPAEQEPFS